jgi:predicted aspartyl protease
MLRLVLILASALALVVAIILMLNGTGGNAPLYAWVAIQVAIVLIALLAERGRYRPRSSRVESGWQPTAERFQDPSTGEWMVVEYNPKTGERRYIPDPTPPEARGEGRQAPRE